MNRPICMPVLAILLLALLAGCASTDTSKVLTQTQQDLAPFTSTPLEIALTPEQVGQRRVAAQRLLAQPLQQADAVGLAWHNSPAPGEAAPAARSVRP